MNAKLKSLLLTDTQWMALQLCEPEVVCKIIDKKNVQRCLNDEEYFFRAFGTTRISGKFMPYRFYVKDNILYYAQERYLKAYA